MAEPHMGVPALDWITLHAVRPGHGVLLSGVPNGPVTSRQPFAITWRAEARGRACVRGGCAVRR